MNGATPRRAGFWATVKAVLWSFFGVRRKADYHQDAASLNPLAVIVAGVLAGLLFVLALVMVVRVVTGA